MKRLLALFRVGGLLADDRKWTAFPPRPDGKGQLALHELDLPQMGVGASLPHIIANEGRLVFGYLAELDGDMRFPAAATAFRDGNVFVLVKTDHCLAFKSGFPNDEVIHGHPYSEFGLESYAVYEVLNSDWIAEIVRINSVHSNHQSGLFAAYRHFIFTFHDSTFEFIAEDVLFSVGNGSLFRQLADVFQDD